MGNFKDFDLGLKQVKSNKIKTIMIFYDCIDIQGVR